MPGDEQAAENLYLRYLELKHLTEHSVYLSVLLAFSEDMPSQDLVMRFFSEKVFGVQISTKSFVSNQKGHAVLPVSHSSVVKEFMKKQARIILAPRNSNIFEQPPSAGTDEAQKDMVCILDKYYHFLTFLFQDHDKLPEDERVAVSYRDYL
jgi:hypothetical protein